MNKTLRNALIAAGTVVALILVLPFVVPLDTYKGRIETAAADATGRTVRIEGPLRLMLFPRLGVRASDVTIANVPDGRAPAMASAGSVEISVRTLPLLTGHVALDRIVLDHPVIALEVDRDGNENWKFGKSGSKSQSKGSLSLPQGAEFAGMEIRDGRVTYDNAKTGTHRAVDRVNLNVAITRLDQPVSVSGDLTIADKKLTFSGRLTTLKTFLGNGTTTVDLSANADLMQASFKGSLREDGTTDGLFKLNSPSFRELAAWLGEPLPGGGLKTLALAGRVHAQDKVTSLDDLTLKLDNQTMKGHLAIDARGKLPVVDGTLAVDRIDLNPYLSSSSAAPQPAAAAPAGWSTAPISLALLKTFNGKLSFQTGSLRVRGLHLGKTAMALSVDNGVLNARLDPVTLYGGSGSAVLGVDARGPVPAFRNTLSFKAIALRPFLSDTMGVDSIEGTGALTLEIASRGRSANEIMHGLAGKGSILGANGRFRGVDLGRVAQTIQSVLGGGATGQTASTEFHTMGGSFVIASGVLTSNDFQLAGPVVQMSGKGMVDIGNRTIDFRLEPHARVAGASIGIPFRVHGSWDHVHYTPDLGDVLKGVMKGLFGGDGKKSDKKNLGETLKDVFGIH